MNSACLIYVKKNVCSLYSLKVANIVKLAAILFLLIRWSKINTHLVKGASRSQHTLLYVKKNVCSLYRLKVANIANWAAILFMRIRWSQITTQLGERVSRIMHTLCVTQPFLGGGLGGAVSPQRGPGQSPGGKRILTTIY